MKQAIIILVVIIALFFVLNYGTSKAECPSCGRSVSVNDILDCPYCGQHICTYCYDDYAYFEHSEILYNPDFLDFLEDQGYRLESIGE